VKKPALSEQSCEVSYLVCFIGWPSVGGEFRENPLVVKFNR
jgi:hypothetical protein